MLQVLTGAGATSNLLARHPHIQKISFTGSGLTGKHMQRAAAESNLKRVRACHQRNPYDVPDSLTTPCFYPIFRYASSFSRNYISFLVDLEEQFSLQP